MIFVHVVLAMAAMVGAIYLRQAYGMGNSDAIMLAAWTTLAFSLATCASLKHGQFSMGVIAGTFTGLMAWVTWGMAIQGLQGFPA